MIEPNKNKTSTKNKIKNKNEKLRYINRDKKNIIQEARKTPNKLILNKKLKE